MSRSGYSDDYDGSELCLYRGAVASAINGRRGQKLLRELLSAMDAMPEKRLIADDLVRDGEYCALGVVGKARDIDMSGLDPHDPETLANVFNIAPALVREIEYENDEAWYASTPEERWVQVRKWAESNVAKESD